MGEQNRSIVIYYLFVTLFALVMIYPLLWMASASFKEDIEIFQSPSLIPQNPTFKKLCIRLERCFRIYFW